MEIKPRIGDIIDKRGLKRKWVADQVGVTRQQLGNWIRGKSYPNAKKMYILAELLNVEITELYNVENGAR